LRKQVEDRISTLQTQIQASELHVTDTQKELAEVERREKGKVVKSQGTNQGKMGVLVSLAKQRTDELRNHLVRLRQERDTSKGRVHELETILSAFKEEYNPNFNDEGVKRAVRAWEDYAARDKTGDDTLAHDRDLDEVTKTDKENGLDWDSYLEAEAEDVEVCEFLSLSLSLSQHLLT
jgi:protein kinase C substrate 80K-H